MPTSAIRLTSRIPRACRDQLEQLLFFNEKQTQFAINIIQSIESFGLPQLIDDGDSIRIEIEGLQGTQALFAVEDSGDTLETLGVIVYARVDETTMVLLHAGVHPDYGAGGKHADYLVLVKLIAELRRIAGRISGIKEVVVMYSRGAIRRLPVA